MKTLNTDQEVIGQIKLLGTDSVTGPIDSKFNDLVWAKVETESYSDFSLSPVYMTVGICMFLAFVLLMIYKPVTPAKKILAPEIPIMGAIIEKNGLPFNGLKSSVEEGNVLSTQDKDELTFFLPGVGYFHLAQNSKVEILKARHRYQTSAFEYIVFLHEGGLYSRLSKLDLGSKLNYYSPYGQVAVTGTDLFLNVNKDDGLQVEVLNGEIKINSKKEPEVIKNVKEGFGALISPRANGNLLITEIKGSRLAELKNEFTEIFKGSTVNQSARDVSKLRIVRYQEMKWKS